MKKVLILCVMFATTFVFANTNINKNEDNIVLISLTDAEKTNENLGKRTRCYVYIYNRYTGERRRVYAEGSGRTYGEAVSNCGKNAYGKAARLVRVLNS